MSTMKKSTYVLGTVAAAGLLAACSSTGSGHVDPSQLQGTALDRNAISVAKRTAFLEVDIDPQASELSLTHKAEIDQFVAAYQRIGDGPLVMSLPASSANPQLAVTAVVEARAIAWENGVQYEEIAGNHHGVDSDVSEPLILAYQTYDAIAPDCGSLASVDLADTSSNNEMPTLGCAVRKNVAAMVANPADLLGQRPIDSADLLRQQTVLEKFRAGESTPSDRADSETGTISDAVD